jgi:hypothetical protein
MLIFTGLLVLIFVAAFSGRPAKASTGLGKGLKRPRPPRMSARVGVRLLFQERPNPLLCAGAEECGLPPPI